jgi:hypothetical protein
VGVSKHTERFTRNARMEKQTFRKVSYSLAKSVS